MTNDLRTKGLDETGGQVSLARRGFLKRFFAGGAALAILLLTASTEAQAKGKRKRKKKGKKG